MIPVPVSPVVMSLRVARLLALITVIPLMSGGCMAKIRDLKNELALRDARILQMTQDTDAARADARVLREENKELKARVETQATELDRAKADLATARTTLTASMDSRQKEMADRLAEAGREVQSQKEKLGELEDRLAQSDHNLALAEEALEAERAKAAAAEETVTQLRETTAAQEKAAATLNASLEEVRQRLATAETAQREAQEEMTRLREQIANGEKAREQLQRDLQTAKGELATANGELEKVRAQATAAEKSLAERDKELATLRKESSTAREEAQTLKTRLQVADDATSAVAQRLAATERVARTGMKSFVDSGAARIQPEKDRVRIILLSDELFQPGTTLLSDNGLRALQAVDRVLRGVQYSRVEVDGHTDNVPVRNMPYPDNWELAAARATEVTRWLVAQPGTDGGRFVALSHSYMQPIASNDNAAGRRQNRRVEVIVYP